MFLFSTLKKIVYYSFCDIKNGRFWGVFCQSLFNVFPDFLGAAFLRPYALYLSGAKFSDISSCVIRKNVFVEVPLNLTIGKNFQINRGSYIDSNGKVIIGDFVRVAMDCKILSMNHSGSKHEIDDIKKTIIKNNVELYAGVVVLPGAIIEDYVVVNSGSVIGGVTKSKGIYGGNPARLISYRTDLDE
jgi:acetyltransferase-like isoleucine patch superfamily enzyme